ncbi:fructose-specific PTS transporter subunit EIIC [Gordonia sp. NPDC003424]
MNDIPKKILAITACPTGIAHTYMAAEKLTEAAEAKGYSIRVETHGSIGVENEFTQKEIDDADAIVIAADKQIDTSRFAGKRLVRARVSEGIHDGAGLIDRALAAEPAAGVATRAEATGERESVQATIYKVLMNGVSHMIPFVVTGGLMIAVALSLGGTPTATGLKVEPGTFWDSVLQIGTLAFTLMVPILSGYIAYAIADRPGLAPGMITGIIAVTGSLYGSESGAGFIGGIITGFLSGYLALALKKIPVHKYLAPIMPIIVIPVVTTVTVGLSFVYMFGGPIAAAYTSLTTFLEGMQGSAAIVLGLVLGAMISFDMGGPVNKTAFLFAGGLIASGNAAPMGMVAAAIAVPPLGMGVATLIRRGLFTEQERESGIAALFMGFFGITEGAIPFAAGRPLQVIPANIAGGAVAGALAGVLGVTDHVMHGGPIVAVLGAVGRPLLFVVAIAAGVAVTALLAVVFIKPRKTKTETAEAISEVDGVSGASNSSVGAAAITESTPVSSSSTTSSGGVTLVEAPRTETAASESSIRDYLNVDTVIFEPVATDRDGLIAELARRGLQTGQVSDVDAVVDKAIAREAQSSTGVGMGIAIPHAKSDGANSPMVAFARMPGGIDWSSLDRKPANLIFLISVPEAQAGTEHLKILAALSRALVKKEFRTALLSATTEQEIVDLCAANVR